MTTPDHRKLGDAKAIAAERARDDQDGRQAIHRDAAAMRAAAARTAARLEEKSRRTWPTPRASWGADKDAEPERGWSR